jgi:hypothetical protein
LIFAVAVSTAFAQEQSSIYQSAVENYSAGQYVQSCSEFHRLFELTGKLRDVSGGVLRAEKTSGKRGFDWQKKAFESDNLHQWAKECAEWYHAALRERADDDLMLTDNDLVYADRAEKHMAEEAEEPAHVAPPSPGHTSGRSQVQHASSPSPGGGCATDEAMQKLVKLVFPCVDTLLNQARTAKQAGQKAEARTAYQRVLQVNSYAGFQRSDDVDKEARDFLNQADAPKGTSPANARSGQIPNGTYKCYTATTATVLAGGSARLNPGSWGGDIQIKGDSYLYGSNPWGHYKVGANGMITWTGGAYSSETLGRYIVENGTPEIVIGWAGVDAGQVCKP